MLGPSEDGNLHGPFPSCFFFYQIQSFSSVCVVYGSEENFWESIFSVLVTGTFIQVPSPPPLWVFSKHKPLWPQFFEEMHFHFAGFVPTALFALGS